MSTIASGHNHVGFATGPAARTLDDTLTVSDAVDLVWYDKFCLDQGLAFSEQSMDGSAAAVGELREGSHLGQIESVARGRTATIAPKLWRKHDIWTVNEPPSCAVRTQAQGTRRGDQDGAGRVEFGQVPCSSLGSRTPKRCPFQSRCTRTEASSRGRRKHTYYYALMQPT